jgi:hypothetical protein
MNGIPGTKSATKIFDALLFKGISLSFFKWSSIFSLHTAQGELIIDAVSS